MNTAVLFERIWYITRYLRVILDEYNPSNLPCSFLPKYGLNEILSSALSAIFLRPVLNSFCRPCLASGEYSSAKFIDLAEDGRRCLYERRFFSLYFLRRTGSCSIAFCHSEFPRSPKETHNHPLGSQVLTGAFDVLVNKLFLMAGICRVQKQPEWSEPYYHLQNKFITGVNICQDEYKCNRVICAPRLSSLAIASLEGCVV